MFAVLARDLGRDIWMLTKPTITLMVLAAVVSSALFVLVPWNTLLWEVTALKAGLISMISVFMPIPIALDVMSRLDYCIKA
ncbi:MAG: hypothetical protein ABI787_02635 [Spartobacteria bacterium]